jgi:hypothetical protein
MDNKPHIKFEGHFEKLSYKYPKTVVITDKSIPLIRNRITHGNFLLDKVNQIKEYFEIEKLENSVLIQDDVVYIEFTSEWGYKLSFDSFDKSGFQLLNVKEEEREIGASVEFRYSLVVVVNEKAINDFLKKIISYLNPLKDKKAKPANKNLLNNIQIIELATLKSFWVDAPQIPFPNENEDIWWEVWFRKISNEANQLDDVLFNLEVLGCKIGLAQLELTDHLVKLVKGTAKQLSQSLLKLGNLAELRSPQQIADFITHNSISFETKQEYLVDLLQRTDSKFDKNSVLICLLDSGVNNLHPLLNTFLPDEHLYSYNDSWGLQDSYPHGGHGTGVAGLALYGDLTDALAIENRIQIYHGLESYKMFKHNDPNNPELYGAITQSGVNTPVIDRPQNLRVYCLTVSDKDSRFKGRPSAWSSAIDKICFGENNEQQLFIVSGGNVDVKKHSDYPELNHIETVHDPAQAYNAITVGTYTRKDKLDISTGYKALAPNGAMAPSNSTSLLFDSHWCNKPDVVFEGGNSSTDGIYVSDLSELKLLSLDSDFPKDIFKSFGDTSGAAGLASKMAAEIRTMYPNLWVETIRALMIHSTDWTNEMLENKKLNDFKEQDIINLLRTVGYGIPNLQKAIYSANNSLTLIAERSIKPYKKEGSVGKYNNFHLFNLPWPKDVLADLAEKDVTLKVTLSYYIEPNPGSRRFVNHYQYHSHQLDFAVIKPNEKKEVFKRRISAASELEDDKKNGTGETWTLGRSSSKGSIRKDYITLSGIEMSERNILAVYPKNGWYKNLKRQDKFNEQVRYSLIISIETPEIEVDLYNPVLNEILVKSN